ncbi:MAG: zinc carboxypeptidase, partial [Pedobacter sp.]|nr:zinc carboxypeptidase [Pedobacter sp.]
RMELLEAFKTYFQQGVANPPGNYTSYIIKAENISRLQKLAELLTKNHIKFAFGGNQNARGFNYDRQKEESFSVGRNDLIVNLHQPAAVLADVLLEPKTLVSDTNTYDITAWALPYVYGLNAYASKENLKGLYPSLDLSMDQDAKTNATQLPLAWAFSWGSTENAKLLIALQQANIKVRQANAPFTIDKNDYPAGTLLVMRAENERLDKELAKTISKIATSQDGIFKTISTGFVDKGKDFGSDGYPLLTSAKVAIVFGDEVSSLGFGEVRFYLEHDLNLHPTIISVQNINSIDNAQVNTLILPSGDYKDDIKEGLAAWVKRGGRLVLIEEAINGVIGKKGFDIKKRDTTTKKDDQKENFGSFANKSKSNFDDAIPGAIYKINLDATHPISYGIGNTYYGLKTDDLIYKPFVQGWNIGEINNKSLMAGVVGKAVRKSLDAGLLIGSQDLGRGQVVYLATDPLFRNFWEIGKTLFNNVIFCDY